MMNPLSEKEEKEGAFKSEAENAGLI